MDLGLLRIYTYLVCISYIIYYMQVHCQHQRGPGPQDPPAVLAQNGILLRAPASFFSFVSQFRKSIGWNVALGSGHTKAIRSSIRFQWSPSCTPL